MNGDFSQWGFEPGANWNGVLHQQGRVLLDQDWNAATQIERYQRRAIARDAFGANVAAVPASGPDGFKLLQATNNGTDVTITFLPGDVWVDGLHLNAPGAAALVRKALYLAPPIQSPQATAASVGPGVRDAVILEAWEESFSAFQDPLQLIEPALGGPDTTERVKTAYALRLLRLEAADECGNLAGKLADVFANKGKLSVTPSSNVVIGGDCPVQIGGGYTGFEHSLYRIEIAEPLAGAARFKWSQFNGGLVGRGVFTSTGGATGTVAISANDQAINHCGLASFYLEALAFDAALGHWRVVLTASATRPQDGTLSLTNIAGGPWPATSPASGFFRLWNGIETVSGFALLAPHELKDGVCLQFQAPLAGNTNYTPGDYWTFPVRAAGVPFDPATWPVNAPPQGVMHHRVPLGILNWTGAPVVTVTSTAGTIHDCRQVFQPLTRLKGCCYYRVGDGMKSFGDFDTIQAAINALPAAGGEICVLPGTYTENLVINAKHDIRLHGCGDDTLLQAAAALPAIKLTGAQNIRIEGLRIVAHNTAQGVLVDATPPSSAIELRNLTIEARTRSAIEVQAGNAITIRDCRVRMADVGSAWHGIFFTGTDGLIQGNSITVQRADGTVNPAAAGRGGLHLGGTSRGVRVLDNLIRFGIGNGITLGTIEQLDVNGIVIGVMGWVVNADDPCGPCLPGDNGIPPTGGGGGTTLRSAGALYEIEITRNRILDMGLNGIGVIGFFDLAAEDEFISVVRLDILRNEIRGCLQRPIEAIPAAMLDSMGYGGISLADVEYLVVRDNLIEGNGPDHIQPVCGIFVLHGEGIDISRNRILHNGAKTAQPVNLAKEGRRGGINIVYGVANTIQATIFSTKLVVPRQDGVPAIKIHDNIVSQPLGQALALTALGPVSVLGNQLTSMGVIPKLASPTFWAGCVLISNLGQSNELYLQLSSFSGIVNGELQPGPGGPDVTDDVVLLPQTGLDDARLGQYLANGNVLFANNQCVLDLSEKGLSLALTSILITTLDDIGFSNNQCDCNLLDDLVLAQAFLFGLSVRMNDNRLKEGLLNALYSAVSIGLMNAATANQSTHCLLVAAVIPSMKVEAGNKALIDAFVPGFCDKLGKSFAALGGSLNMFS
jgi:Family of unknown function (DUF6519)